MKKKILIVTAVVIIFLGCAAVLLLNNENKLNNENNPKEKFPVSVNSEELLVSSQEGYNSVKIYKQKNLLVVNAESEAEFFDGVQFTVQSKEEITADDVEIIWMTIGGSTERSEDNDRIIAEIKISEDSRLICDTKINFAKKAFDAVEDVLK